MSDVIERYVNAFLLAAAKLEASHIRVRPMGEGVSVEFWVNGAWTPQGLSDPNIPIHMRIMRRLSVMLGELVPPRGKVLTGGIGLRVGGDDGDDKELYYLVAIDHDMEVAAHIELVDKHGFETRTEPRPPAGHPFRSLPS
jgi:hypothetical protein